ncbi:MAG: MarP family serine protease [Sciscionella sp.]
MNWVDVIVVLLALVAIVAGAKQGLVVTVPAIALLLGGAVLGIKIAPLVVTYFDSMSLRAVFSFTIPVLLAALGETFGVWLGRTIKIRIRNRHLAAVDNALGATVGAVLQAGMVFVVAWLFVLPLTSVPGLPTLTSAINGSTVLGTVNSLMPQAVRGLPGDLRRQLNIPDLPTVSNPFSQTPVTQVGPPNTALQRSAVVREVQGSVLKVRARAPQCSRQLEGSGFVIAPHRVMTNAHVVAGTSEVAVHTESGSLTAYVVYYDPDVDIAVLSVPGLDATPLHFDHAAADPGADGVVLGYPLDGPYTASAAKVRERINLRGPNIYDSKTVTRDVYTVRAIVRQGNSGGPLIEPNGEVMGVVFGAAVDNKDTGFVLTEQQVAHAVAVAPNLHSSVSTGDCTA